MTKRLDETIISTGETRRKVELDSQVGSFIMLSSEPSDDNPSPLELVTLGGSREPLLLIPDYAASPDELPSLRFSGSAQVFSQRGLPQSTPLPSGDDVTPPSPSNSIPLAFSSGSASLEDSRVDESDKCLNSLPSSTQLLVTSSCPSSNISPNNSTPFPASSSGKGEGGEKVLTPSQYLQDPTQPVQFADSLIKLRIDPTIMGLLIQYQITTVGEFMLLDQLAPELDCFLKHYNIIPLLKPLQHTLLHELAGSYSVQPSKQPISIKSFAAELPVSVVDDRLNSNSRAASHLERHAFISTIHDLAAFPRSFPGLYSMMVESGVIDILPDLVTRAQLMIDFQYDPAMRNPNFKPQSGPAKQSIELNTSWLGLQSKSALLTADNTKRLLIKPAFQDELHSPSDLPVFALVSADETDAQLLGNDQDYLILTLGDLAKLPLVAPSSYQRLCALIPLLDELILHAQAVCKV